MLKHQEKHKNQQMLKASLKWCDFSSFWNLTGHDVDVVGQSVPGGRTRMSECPLAKLRAQPW